MIFRGNKSTSATYVELRPSIVVLHLPTTFHTMLTPALSVIAGYLLLSVRFVATFTPAQYDALMLIGAQEEYARAHGLRTYEPQQVGVEPYRNIADLKQKALAAAARSGYFKGAMKIGVRGSRDLGSRAIWFSTIVHPGDALGREMRLVDQLALLLWCQDTWKRLLWITLVPNRGVHWGLQDLKTVLGRP